jgi:DNA-binding CsgD family transcriptional regulator/predicted negative regulator of RcsB-dependent stress response
MVLTGPPERVVGRDRELAALHNDLDAASQGNGRLVLVSGEAGIGKTALLTDLARMAEKRGLLVLSGAAYDHESTPPYGPWFDLFETYPGSDELPEPPGWLRVAAPGAALESQETLFHEVHQLLASAASTVPLLIVLEDLHWADRGTLEMLRYVARRVHRLPILLAVSCREKDLSGDMPLFHLLPALIRESGAKRVQLERLDKVAIHQFVAQRYALAPDDRDRLTGYLHAHAEGIPLFIHELLREMADERVLARNNDGWTVGRLDTVPVPSLVRQMIEARLRRLDEDVRALVSVAALIGHEVSYNLWRQVSDTDEAVLERVIDVALAADILVQQPGGTLAFSHALVREALQARLILPRRRNLHRRTAEALMERPGQDQNSSTIAYHLRQARDPRAREWLVRAGKRACSVYACETAIDMLSTALEMKGDRDVALDLRALHLRGTAYEIVGEFSLALQDHQSVLRLARERGDTQLIWQALIDLGSLWTARDYREAGDYYRQALDLAHAVGEDEMLAHSLNRMGNLHTNLDRPVVAMDHHQQALQIFRKIGDEHGIAVTLDLLAIAAYLYGDLPASEEHLRQAARIFREHDNRQALASLLPTLMVTRGSYDSDTVGVAEGTIDEALGYGIEGRDLARAIGWRAGEAYAMVHIGYMHGLHGRYGVALDLTREGLHLATNIAHRQWTAAGHCTVGIVLADMQITQLAGEHLTEALNLAKAMNANYWTRTATAGLAWVCLMQDDLDQADDLLGQVLTQEIDLNSMGIRQCWFRRAELHLARNEAETALDIVEQLIASAPGNEHGMPVPHLEWLKGRILLALGRLDVAERSLGRARSRARQLSYRSLVWRIDLDLGRLYSRQDREDAALEAFTSGRQLIADISGSIDDAALQAEFRDQALALFPQAGPVNAGDTRPAILSPRETEILRLVTRGLTDAEIGEQLYISPRTVGRHLQSVYNKLGVNSRTAASMAAMEQHLLET